MIISNMLYLIRNQTRALSEIIDDNNLVSSPSFYRKKINIAGKENWRTTYLFRRFCSKKQLFFKDKRVANRLIKRPFHFQKLINTSKSNDEVLTIAKTTSSPVIVIHRFQSSKYIKSYIVKLQLLLPLLLVVTLFFFLVLKNSFFFFLVVEAQRTLRKHRALCM